jgi:ADP-ribose pyrophosphatase YjhB (NUDIX family)
MSSSSPSDGCHRFESLVPAGDDRARRVCRDCGFVDYRNPKVVVGAVVVHGDRVLLCRRAIDPARGAWTLPSGHLEHGETTEEGALREAWEEARARIEIDDLLGVYTSPTAGVVHVFYRAHLEVEDVAPGPESLEVGFVPWSEIPWETLAFPVDAWALERSRPDAVSPARERHLSNPACLD